MIETNMSELTWTNPDSMMPADYDLVWAVCLVRHTPNGWEYSRKFESSPGGEVDQCESVDYWAPFNDEMFVCPTKK